MKFLVLLDDGSFGDSPEERYTVKQVMTYLKNVVDELSVLDVQETNPERTKIYDPS